MPIQCRGYRALGSFVGPGYEIERRRFTANLSRGELTESRHDLGPRGECQDFPDAMNIVERERHVVSSKRGRMNAGDAASGPVAIAAAPGSVELLVNLA